MISQVTCLRHIVGEQGSIAKVAYRLMCKAKLDATRPTSQLD